SRRDGGGAWRQRCRRQRGLAILRASGDDPAPGGLCVRSVAAMVAQGRAMFSPSRLFISYRRSDAERCARALYEALKARFGEARLFFDTANIPFGEDFRRIVRERIRRSAVVLVVTGPVWDDALNERGPRLGQEDDPVRFELTTALESGRRIVPVR